MARGERGVGDEEQTLAKEIQAFEATAVPYMLALLESDNEAIRQFAGYVVRDLKGLTERDLDALFRARAAGDGWIPPAIAHVGTPRAVQFLLDDLRQRPQAMTQVTHALRILGARAAVPLARTFLGDAPVEGAWADAICEVLGEMHEEAAPAVPILIDRVRRGRAPLANRIGAIRSLGCMRAVARAATPALVAVATQPELKNAANNALRNIGGPEGVAVLVEEIRTKSDLGAFVRLAAMGADARAAVPVVIAQLGATDPDVRVYAARALGFIGDESAAAPLGAVLADNFDWRLPFSAAQSLGRLHAKSALPALDALAAAHWYPPVRDAAKQAAVAIRESAPPPALKGQMLGLEFAGFLMVRGPRLVADPTFVPGPSDLTAGELKAMAYDTEVKSYGEDGEHVNHIKQAPGTGVKTTDGFLLGATRGEWGGELVYLDPKLQGLTRLLETNVVGVHRTSAGIVVVTGLSHMFTNHGELYLAKPASTGKYEMKRWKVLPGAPHRSGMLNGGSLLVQCTGGDVVLKGDRLEVAPGAQGGASD